MKIYIASSWRNEHGVVMLTRLLRDRGHSVDSWIENNYGEKHNHVTKALPFEEWVQSTESDQSFQFDTNGAITCDLFIYYGPAGSDAAAELGAAWASGIPCIGLSAKGDGLGLMRKMVKWCISIWDLLGEVARCSCIYRDTDPAHETDRLLGKF